jgi:hypothetical protein
MFPLADLSLARRLERAEAVANARFVDARARLMPESAAQWIEVAGAYAMYDGVRSPCTQTFGLGLFETPTSGDMDKLEEFFTNHQAPTFHEVSPLAEKGLIPMLSKRGYRPIELSNVLFMPLAGRISALQNSSVRARIAGKDEQDLWSSTAAEGWREFTEIADLMFDLMRVCAAAENRVLFFAELDSRPIATGSLAVHDDVALFAGASTIPEWRRRGAQQVLFETRCRYAAEAGCELAMVCAEPGSSSQRNAERQGFRVAYTRIKWTLLN